MKKFFLTLFTCFSIFIGCANAPLNSSYKDNTSTYPFASVLYLEYLTPQFFEASASGFVIRTDDETSIGVTADHVCDSVGFPLIKVYSFDGRGSIGEILERTNDPVVDVCLIKFKTIPGIEPVKFATLKPLPGSKITSLGVPMGMFEPNIVFISEGLFLGENKDGSYHYSLEIQPGMSGSVVLNENYEVIGLISGFMKAWNKMSFGPSFTSIQSLIKELD